MASTSIFDDLASIFAATSGGRASGRFNEAILNNARDQLANQQFGQQSTNAVNQADFKAKQPGVQAGNAVRGDILANGQDATVSGLPDYVQMPTLSGGLRPSMFSQGTREAGGSMARNALTSQLKGGDAINFPTAPTLTPVPQAGALDSLLNVGSAAAGGAGLLKKVLGALGGGGSAPVGGGVGGGDSAGGQDYGSSATVPEMIPDPGVGYGIFDTPPTPSVTTNETYAPPEGVSPEDWAALMGQLGGDYTGNPEDQYAGQNGRF